MSTTIAPMFDYTFGTSSFDECIDYPNSSLINMPFLSPPGSTSSEPGLEFDLGSFSHDSPSSSLLADDTFNWDYDPTQSEQKDFGSLDLPPSFDIPSFNSTRLVTPGTSISSLGDIHGITPSSSLIPTPPSVDTVEALSNHHLQRYLHYQALANQAEADVRAAATMQSQQEYETILASCSMPSYPLQKTIAPSAMFGYSPPALGQDAPQYLAYNPQHQADLARAQAQAHLLAHDVAAARAEQQRAQTGYWVAATQTAFSAPPSQFQPVSTGDILSSLPDSSVFTPSTIPPALDTTSLVAPIPVATPSPVPVATFAASISSRGDGEYEPEDDSEDESMGQSGVIPNIKGGGRGYIPGQTPDDPKKRHKCSICGRAFARAFNLKSHAQTHNPVRAKPHQCPHSTCKRGFSRLHDLERHRQGIHNDGPLASAKTTGVSSSTVRAQARTVKRDTTSTSSLISHPK